MLEGKKFIYNPKFVFVVAVTTIRFVNSSYFFRWLTPFISNLTYVGCELWIGHACSMQYMYQRVIVVFFNSKVKLANKDIRIQQKSWLDLTLGRCKLCAGFSPVKTQQQSQEFIWILWSSSSLLSQVSYFVPLFCSMMEL